MPTYKLELDRGNGSAPEIVPQYVSDVSFGPGMTLPPLDGDLWQVDRVSVNGLTLQCKLVSP
jgi:hypothetical protein